MNKDTNTKVTRLEAQEKTFFIAPDGQSAYAGPEVSFEPVGGCSSFEIGFSEAVSSIVRAVRPRF